MQFGIKLALQMMNMNFTRGGLEVTESGLERWSCGAAANTAYASSCVSGRYGFVYLTQILSGVMFSCRITWIWKW